MHIMLLINCYHCKTKLSFGHLLMNGLIYLLGIRDSILYKTVWELLMMAIFFLTINQNNLMKSSLPRKGLYVISTVIVVDGKKCICYASTGLPGRVKKLHLVQLQDSKKSRG
jgi:hypothetical protein